MIPRDGLKFTRRPLLAAAGEAVGPGRVARRWASLAPASLDIRKGGR
jgi:hypothetical protein